MLHTTAEFNAFQIVVESRKFDMNEPLIVHLREIISVWRLVIVDPAGMALLLDKTDVDDLNSFLLVKTLVRTCSMKLEMDLQATEVQYAGEWHVYRGRGALSFLNCLSDSSVLITLSDSNSCLLALVKALCRIGVCLNPRVGVSTVRRLSFTHLRKLEWQSLRKGFSVLAALSDMFRNNTNEDIEYFVAHLIRMDRHQL